MSQEGDLHLRHLKAMCHGTGKLMADCLQTSEKAKCYLTQSGVCDTLQLVVNVVRNRGVGHPDRLNLVDRERHPDPDS